MLNLPVDKKKGKGRRGKGKTIYPNKGYEALRFTLLPPLFTRIRSAPYGIATALSNAWVRLSVLCFA